MRETSLVQPKSPYAISKLISENVVREFELSELPWVILRLFNAYGSNATHPYFIPDVIRQCVKASEIRIGNLESARDLSHVSDTAEAIFRALHVPGIEGQTINVCSGNPWRMSAVLQRIQELTEATAKKVIVDTARLRPPGMDPEILVGENEKARRVLAWLPKVTFEVGLERTIKEYLSSGGWPYEHIGQPIPAGVVGG